MKKWTRKLQSFVAKADDLSDSVRLRLRRPYDGRRLIIVPYIGYETAGRLLVNGRVLEDEGYAAPRQEDTGWRNFAELYKRLESDEVPGARVRARFNGREQEVVADGEGYFRFEFKHDQPSQGTGFRTVELELVAPAVLDGQSVRASVQVLSPPATARFGVISDIDDTIVWTNVAHKLRMLLTLARSNAHTRKPFKGVAGFYRALHNGTGGSEENPIFYVSSSPLNLYTPLVDFLSVQDIPLGPLLLRDFGDHSLFTARDHHSHKLSSIEQILSDFPHLQFILIGDSGEQDPEIYSQVVNRYPRRIRVIYIRSVNPDPARIAAIDRLIVEVQPTGTQLVLAPDSEFAAAHAAAEGLISASDLAYVRSDKRRDEPAADPKAQRRK